MFDRIDHKNVYVVELDTMPNLPVYGTGVEQHYAEALTQAILRGIISEPGKYAIHILWDTIDKQFEIYRIDE